MGQQLHGAGLLGKGPGPQQPAPDRFGLLGLLSVIRWAHLPLRKPAYPPEPVFWMLVRC